MKIAIYSRKSVYKENSESILNQIELCKNYCERNFKGEEIEYFIFSDEGFTGANTNRPDFKAMMKKINNKQIDKLVCYKLDRISRSVLDFSKIYDNLTENNVDFISIVEQFDTSSIMGKAMLQICSVFAEMERNTIAERVKSSMIESSKRGIFLGGKPALGFEIKRVKYLNEEMKEKQSSVLVPNIEELELVSYLYKEYLRLGSITQLEKTLYENNIKNRAGFNFCTSSLADILRNPVYVKSNNEVHEYLKSSGMQVYGVPNGNGYLIYNKNKQKGGKKDISEWICAISKNKGCINSKLWLEVQHQLNANKDKQIKRLGTGNNPSLLSGILKCRCGANMLPKRNGAGHVYYICQGKRKRGNKCTSKNLKVEQIDKLVISSISTYSKDILSRSLNDYLKDAAIKNQDKKIRYSIENQISKKETFMNGLIDKLALSNNDRLTEILMKQINDADKEIKELKIKLENNKIEEQENKSNINNINAFIENLKYFNKNIDLMEDIQPKRELLRRIIKYVIWDSETYTATIEYNIDLPDEESKKK